MGLFNIFKPAAVPDLSDLKAAYAAFQNSYKYADKIAACDRLVSAIENTKSFDVIRVFNAEGRKERGYIYHSELGIMWNGENYLNELAEKAQKERKRAVFLLAKSQEFQSALESIPETPVSILADAPQLQRLPLSEMPEVSYVNVTKSFNRDRLPAFVVIDTETNGLKVQGGRILELSAIRYEDFQPVARWSSLVNPGKPIPAEASAVNHITDEMVAGAPTLAQVAASFSDFVGSSPLVGYNLPFDLKFLYSRGINLFQAKRKYYDVLEIARKAYKKHGFPDFKLSTVAEECRIIPSDAHRSLSDCYTTGLVFQNCINEITEA